MLMELWEAVYLDGVKIPFMVSSIGRVKSLSKNDPTYGTGKYYKYLNGPLSKKTLIMLWHMV